MEALYAKSIIFYSSWGLLLVFSFFRYQLWHIFDDRYCSETNLLSAARTILKPDSWLLLAVLVLTAIVATHIYTWADSRWLWFSHYGRTLSVGILFMVLFSISWRCA